MKAATERHEAYMYKTQFVLIRTTILDKAKLYIYSFHLTKKSKCVTELGCDYVSLRGNEGIARI